MDRGYIPVYISLSHMGYEVRKIKGRRILIFPDRYIVTWWVGQEVMMRKYTYLTRAETFAQGKRDEGSATYLYDLIELAYLKF